MNRYDPASARHTSQPNKAPAFSSRPHRVPATTGAARCRGEQPERLVAGSAGSAGTASRPAADPVIAALVQLRSFFREGWSFIARLAERMPHAFFAGWSL